MTQQTINNQYVCIDFVEINGLLMCKSWQKLEHQPILSSLTHEQLSDLTESVLFVLLLTFGWCVLIKMVKDL